MTADALCALVDAAEYDRAERVVGLLAEQRGLPRININMAAAVSTLVAGLAGAGLT